MSDLIINDPKTSEIKSVKLDSSKAGKMVSELTVKACLIKPTQIIVML